MTDARELTHSSHWGGFTVRVRDGEIEAVRPLHDPDPSPLLANLPGSLRHPTRIARPVARRGWLERGPGPTRDRGSDSFVELSWDEALDRAAAELARVRGAHGNRAIFGGSYGWASAGMFHQSQSQLHRFLNTIGGFTSHRGSYSIGASLVLLPHLVGSSAAVFRKATTWNVIAKHTELLVAFGGLPHKNTFVAPGGMARHGLRGHLADAHRRGMRIAHFSPLRDDVVPEAGARWYPVIPLSDVAVMLGLAHALVSEGLHDEVFLERCCTGAKQFIAYVMGEADGVAKTPEWAEQRSGIPARDLRELAREMARRRTLVTVSYSLQRAQHGEQPIWAALSLAALLGQIGLPGGGFGHGYGSMGDLGSPTANLPLPGGVPEGRNAVRDFIPCARIADLLLRPGERFDYNGASLSYPDIRLVYWAGGNPFHHHQDLNRLRRALGRPDTVIVHEPYWTPMARHADLVFPATTSLERNDIGSGRADARIIAMQRAVEPVGEARSDHDILAGLAERFGPEVREAFTEGRDERGWLEHLYERVRDALADVGVAAPTFDAVLGAGLDRGPGLRSRARAVRVVPRGSRRGAAQDPEREDRAVLRDGGALRVRRLSGPCGVARERGVAGLEARGPVPAGAGREQSGDAAARAARRRRVQPGVEGARSRARADAPVRRVGARDRGRGRGAAVQRSRELSGGRGNHDGRAAACRAAVDGRVVRSGRPARRDRHVPARESQRADRGCRDVEVEPGVRRTACSGRGGEVRLRGGTGEGSPAARDRGPV